MVTDLWLAILHHVLVFGLVIMLAAQLALVRPNMNWADAARVGRLDIGYGATAGLVVIVGTVRVIYGAKGYLYYVDNPWFWAKMVSFASIALLSIPPTFRFRAWLSEQKTNAHFAPSAADVSAVRTLLRVEVLLLIAVVAFAATMARYTRL